MEENFFKRYSKIGWLLFAVTLIFGLFTIDISDIFFPENKLSVQISSDTWIIPDFDGTRRTNYWGGIPEPSVDILYGVRSLWNLSIINKGSKEAKDIEAYIPSMVGMYAIDDLKPKKFEGDVVKLGDLKPGAVRYLNVWSTNLSSNGLGREDIRISYESGLAKLRFSREVNGLKLFIAENIYMIAVILLALLGCALLIVLDNKKTERSV